MSAVLACRGDIGTLLDISVPFTHEDSIGASNYTLGSMVQNLPPEWMTVNETRVWLPSERKLKAVDPESLFSLGDSSMSGLVRMAIDRYVNLVDSISDPRVNDWPLMDSPMPTLAMIVAYLYIVVILGPRLMANRKPFQLKGVLIVYNAIQVIFSLVMLWEHLMSGWLLDYSYKCQPVDYSHNPTALRMANLCWWYYISKLTEFMDTIFFVLRKKDNQVTILHLYHHTLTPIETWICVKFLAGGHGTFSNLVNNGVHVVMYFYYMVAAMGPQYQKYIWWKKYLTTLQLTTIQTRLLSFSMEIGSAFLQFTLVFIHSAQVLVFDCGYPKLVAALLLLHSVIFFALFFDFYQQAYKKSRKLQEKVH